MAIGSETWDECRARSEQTIGGQLAWCGNCELTHKRLGLPCEEHTRWDEREERARLFAQRWPACSAAITAESMRVLDGPRIVQPGDQLSGAPGDIELLVAQDLVAQDRAADVVMVAKIDQVHERMAENVLDVKTLEEWGMAAGILLGPANARVLADALGAARGGRADFIEGLLFAASRYATAGPAGPAQRDPDPGIRVRVTVGNFAGFVGVVQPRGDDDPPGWSRVRSDGRYGETRLFESKHLATVP